MMTDGGEATPTRTGRGEEAPGLVILIPVFNDWAPLATLLGRLDTILRDGARRAEVLVVNDGSTERPAAGWPDAAYHALARVLVLDLRRNVGHQRAIAIGLAYAHQHLAGAAILVMDGDGEDDPGDVPRLLARFATEEHARMVFAGRMRRSESLLFRLFYRAYRFGHRLLTGHSVQVGNFSVLSSSVLDQLVVVSELWNHFAAAVYSARIPFAIVPTTRGARLGGRSRMGFVALVVHGLRALSVFGDIIAVRLLVAASALLLLTIAGLGAALLARLVGHAPLPDWASLGGALAVVVLGQTLLLFLGLAFVLLGARQSLTFIPLRDYRYFCGDARTLFPRP